MRSLLRSPKEGISRSGVPASRLDERCFGIRPTSFVNTELIYNNQIADIVDDMGYLAILCESRHDMFAHGRLVAPNSVFRAKGSDLIVIPRNKALSDDIAYGFSRNPITAEQYSSSIAGIGDGVAMLAYDFDHIGEQNQQDRGIFEFWRTCGHWPNTPIWRFKTVTQIAEIFRETHCQYVDINGLTNSSWADVGRNTAGRIGNLTQYEVFKDIERLEVDERARLADLQKKWRYLTTTDHIYFMHESFGQSHGVHSLLILMAVRFRLPLTSLPARSTTSR